ncbi:cytidylate kinase family protein [Brucepastera parasyntrophica]|uniref:(d)CMP kinase n=1 Tax=Brucepastera parasyntrophica TaxID=2880008 RepID=UPI00210F00FC|nr:cytidylate kinase family protein [Brucepastera parasyntrophica]ULQ60059.1 cytidylate kinase family protein [Brucepastera parasyntrophica]
MNKKSNNTNACFCIPDNSELRIAISGRSGCGNTTVSRLLAETLGIAFINYTFRSLALELNISFEEIIENAKKDFIYDKMVDTKQIELAGKTSCVLGSRLAIWMLEDADLKIYLTASEYVRAKRIQKREGGDFQEIREYTAMRDAEDTRRYWELYQIDNTDFSVADMVINVENYFPEQIVQIIVEELIEKEMLLRGKAAD